MRARFVGLRLVCALSAMIAYALAFHPLYDRLGPGAAMLPALPVAATALLLGPLAGILAALLCLPLHALLIDPPGHPGWDDLLQQSSGPETVALVVIGGVLGWLRHLSANRGAQRVRGDGEGHGSEAPWPQLHDRAIQAAATAISISDLGQPDHPLIFVNPAFTRLTGWTAKDMVGRSWHVLHGPDSDPGSVETIATALRKKRECRVALKQYRKDGTPFWAEVALSPVRDAHGRLTHVIGTHTDITPYKGQQSFHDPLTNLPNRSLFIDRLQHALAHAGRRQGVIATLFLDLDRFKVINDSLGHEVGDQTLVAVAQRLRECVRQGDTLARLGGDEFAILLEDLVDVNKATQIAERSLQALRAPFAHGDGEVFVAASIGIALSSPDYDLPDDLLRDATAAMQRAKDRGQGGYEIFDTSMHTDAAARLELETALRRAIEHVELRVYYQPIVRIETGRIVGLEALVRWLHPGRGLISPAEFIPLAEETGLILSIGRWVLEEVCQQGREWHARYPSASPVMMSVNLSARQFQRPNLVAEIDRVLLKTGFAPRSLKLEITESVAMGDAEAASRTLQALRRLGVRLAIDDFGTGYSSLSYLKRFPVDTLKIDKSFVDGLGHDPEDTAIVGAVITLAHSLDLEVTAEGVETAEQLARLRELGCELGQGYHFAKPLTAEAVEALLARGTLAPDRAPALTGRRLP